MLLHHLISSSESHLEILFIHFHYIYLCMCVRECHDDHMEVRRQLAGIVSLHSLCGSQESNSGYQPCSKYLCLLGLLTSPYFVYSACGLEHAIAKVWKSGDNSYIRVCFPCSLVGSGSQTRVLGPICKCLYLLCHLASLGFHLTHQNHLLLLHIIKVMSMCVAACTTTKS